MPYAENNGVKIYYPVDGEEPPLELMHGLEGQGAMWKDVGTVYLSHNTPDIGHFVSPMRYFCGRW